MARVRVFKSYLKTPFIILLFAETVIVLFSVYLATYIRFFNSDQPVYSILEGLLLRASLLALITSVSMLATGLYQGRIREGMSGILLRLVISLVASGLIFSLLFFISKNLFIGRGVLAIALIFSFFMIGTLRAVFVELVDTETFKKKILVYGAGKTAAHIDAKLRRKSDRRSFSIVGYVLLDNQQQVVDDKKVIHIPVALLTYIKNNEIDEIVVATSDVHAEIPVKDLVECKLHGIEVVDILTFFEREVGQIRIDIMEPGWLIFSDGFNQSRIKDIFKRLFDISSSLIILGLSFPFIVFAFIAIKLEEGIRAPVLYHQTRVGKQGENYRVYKFRSMRTDAEAGGAIWASKTDNRVTRVGSFIRKTRIDELPQIYNVLNGDMSFVGPRPERPEFVDKLEEKIPHYQDRHLVKPGITGWAQLMYPYGSSVTDAYQKQLYDMYYIKNHSLFLDFLILLQTVEVVLFGKGAR